MNIVRIGIKQRRVLWELALNDVRARFSSSVLGAAWTILQPLVNMIVIWGVFQLGFKTANLNGDIPFIVWYMPAFLIWNYFQEAFSQSANSVIEYSYLVKKVNFSVEIIPMIKVLSNAIIHVFFIGFIVVVNLCYGRYPNLYNLQCIYYFICISTLTLGLGFLTAGITPFVTDVGNLVAIILQTGFWATPIFWDPSSLTDTAMRFMRLNPMFYICTGYRNCFVYGIPFYKDMGGMVYFWLLTIFVWIIGTKVFRKSKQQFDDVL